MALHHLHVDLEALVTAAHGITESVQQVKDADVHDLVPAVAAAGHDGLAAALDEFQERWERGVNHLVGDVEEVGGRLAETAVTYIEAERAVVERFTRLAEEHGQ